MSRCRPRHFLMFSQGPAQRENSKWIYSNSQRQLGQSKKKLEGGALRWKQLTSHPPIDLYPNFTAEDKARLRWRWDSSAHGGLIELGIDTPTSTVQGRTDASYFRVWFSFRGAKRLSSGEFRVEGSDPKNPRDKGGWVRGAPAAGKLPEPPLATGHD